MTVTAASIYSECYENFYAYILSEMTIYGIWDCETAIFVHLYNSELNFVEEILLLLTDLYYTVTKYLHFDAVVLKSLKFLSVYRLLLILNLKYSVESSAFSRNIVQETQTLFIPKANNSKCRIVKSRIEQSGVCWRCWKDFLYHKVFGVKC